MYTTKNFKTKKELKAAVDAWNNYQQAARLTDGGNPLFAGTFNTSAPKGVTYYQPGPFGGNEPRNGEFSIEGPHYPEPHRWYARVVARDGVIVKVK